MYSHIEEKQYELRKNIICLYDMQDEKLASEIAVYYNDVYDGI